MDCSIRHGAWWESSDSSAGRDPDIALNGRWARVCDGRAAEHTKGQRRTEVDLGIDVSRCCEQEQYGLFSEQHGQRLETVNTVKVEEGTVDRVLS